MLFSHSLFAFASSRVEVHAPEMQAQYSSASTSRSEAKVTLDVSGQGVCWSGVTLGPSLGASDLLGVHGSSEAGAGEHVCCWARLHLEIGGKNDTRRSYQLGTPPLTSSGPAPKPHKTACVYNL